MRTILQQQRHEPLEAQQLRAGRPPRREVSVEKCLHQGGLAISLMVN